MRWRAAFRRRLSLGEGLILFTGTICQLYPAVLRTLNIFSNGSVDLPEFSDIRLLVLNHMALSWICSGSDVDEMGMETRKLIRGRSRPPFSTSLFSSSSSHGRSSDLIQPDLASLPDLPRPHGALHDRQEGHEREEQGRPVHPHRLIVMGEDGEQPEGDDEGAGDVSSLVRDCVGDGDTTNGGAVGRREAG